MRRAGSDRYASIPDMRPKSHKTHDFFGWVFLVLLIVAFVVLPFNWLASLLILWVGVTLLMASFPGQATAGGIVGAVAAVVILMLALALF